MWPLMVLCVAPTGDVLAELKAARGQTIARWEHRAVSSLISRLESDGKPIWDGDSVGRPGEPELLFDDLLLGMIGQCPAGERCNEFRREELRQKAAAARALAASVRLFELELSEGATVGEYDFKTASFPVTLALKICRPFPHTCFIRAGADPKKAEVFTGRFNVPVSDRAEAEYIARWRDDLREPKRVKVLFTLTGRVIEGRVEVSPLAIRVFGFRPVSKEGAHFFDPWVLLDHFPTDR